MTSSGSAASGRAANLRLPRRFESATPRSGRRIRSARDGVSVSENSPRRCAISGRTQRQEAYDEAETRPFTGANSTPRLGLDEQIAPEFGLDYQAKSTRTVG